MSDFFINFTRNPSPIFVQDTFRNSSRNLSKNSVGNYHRDFFKGLSLKKVIFPELIQWFYHWILQGFLRLFSNSLLFFIRVSLVLRLEFYYKIPWGFFPSFLQEFFNRFSEKFPKTNIISFYTWFNQILYHSFDIKI